ncbi:killer cell lectin-like receptor subfamily B member 1B allele C isoform X2 [Pelodiscus sinensis]|uniref:killer cell lectin-like receptor subfamily B member 1B allele C isoform X2 n=1 Tax=Pelodiscus sinensis TaxID=13735 RepID=UPI003F6CDAEE
MPEEIVYADLDILKDSSPASQPSPLKHHAPRELARRHRLSLWIALAGNMILATTVIALATQVFQSCSPQTAPNAVSSVPESGSVAERLFPSCKPDRNLEELVSRLNQSLCHAAQRPSGSSECKLCPMDWLSHRGKCYWVSKENAGWNASWDDCSAKGAHLLVIQDWEEFLHNFTQGQIPAWLGLRVTSPEKNWTWVDNSTWNQTLFPVSGAADVNSCGMIKGNRIRSETCTAEFRWICQKEAVSL